MFCGSLGFFCFHFKQRKAKNADHVFAGRKKGKMAKKILRNVERRKTGLCEKSRMFDNLKASHSIVLIYHKPQLHPKVFCCMNLVLPYTMDLTLNLFYVDNLILV